MRTFLLVAHVAAAILFLGPCTLASSAFARAATAGTLDTARFLHRVTRGYGMCSIAVPAVGWALADRIEAFDQLWVRLALGVFLGGFALVVGVIVPAQRRALADLADARPIPVAQLSVLRLTSGLYAASWLVILYLMIDKPTS